MGLLIYFYNIKRKLILANNYYLLFLKIVKKLELQSIGSTLPWLNNKEK